MEIKDVYRYRISSNNSQGREGDYSREAIISNIAQPRSRAINIFLYYPVKSKNYHVKSTEHGLFKSSKFGSLINFERLNGLWPVLLDLIRQQLDWEEIKEREDCERGGEKAIILSTSIKGGRLFERGD